MDIEDEDDTNKNKKNNIVRIPYMKLKLNTQYPSNNINIGYLDFQPLDY